MSNVLNLQREVATCRKEVEVEVVVEEVVVEEVV
jgi:hypothetical protein